MLDELRKRIDEIDVIIARLYAERMSIVGKIAEEKKRTGMSVFDSGREVAVLEKVKGEVPPEIADRVGQVFEKIMETSREYQEDLLDRSDDCDG